MKIIKAKAHDPCEKKTKTNKILLHPWELTPKCLANALARGLLPADPSEKKSHMPAGSISLQPR